MKDLDVSKDADKQQIYDVLGSAVLNDLAVRVQIDGDVEQDSSVEIFIAELKERPNLHFYVEGSKQE